MWRANRCPGCGGQLDETARPEHEDRYRPLPPIECYRCVGFHRSREVFKDHPTPEALIHRVPAVPKG